MIIIWAQLNPHIPNQPKNKETDSQQKAQLNLQAQKNIKGSPNPIQHKKKKIPKYKKTPNQ